MSHQPRRRRRRRQVDSDSDNCSSDGDGKLNFQDRVCVELRELQFCFVFFVFVLLILLTKHYYVLQCVVDKLQHQDTAKTVRCIIARSTWKTCAGRRHLADECAVCGCKTTKNGL